MEQNALQSVAAVATAPPLDTFRPLIIALCCNWCSYAGADLAGVSRIQYPPSIRVIRVMCSGMVHPSLVIEALTKGADGVLMCGCHIGDCHYQDGNVRAERRAEAIRVMLVDFGIEEGRFRLEWVSAAEGPRFAEVVRSFTEQVQKLGPNPYRSMAGDATEGAGIADCLRQAA